MINVFVFRRHCHTTICSTSINIDKTKHVKSHHLSTVIFNNKPIFVCGFAHNSHRMLALITNTRPIIKPDTALTKIILTSQFFCEVCKVI